MRAAEVHDVLILGGGPAGSAAAISLARQGLTIAVLERSIYNGERIGETLPPQTVRLLQSLGVWEKFQQDGHLPSPGIVSVWATSEPYENDFLFNPYGNGWHLDRARFDAMLADSAAAAGARVLRGVRLRSCERSGDGWRACGECDGQPLELRGRFAIDATGQSAWLAQRNGARRISIDPLVGIIGFGERSDAHDCRTVLEAAPDGWWYSARLPGGRTVAAYMTDADLLPHEPGMLLQTWRKRLEQSPLTRQMVAEPSAVTELRVVTARTATLDCVFGDGWIAVGDAATTYDPLSSHGITKALDTGIRGAQAVVRHVLGETGALTDYGARIATEFTEYRHRQADYYGQVSRWTESPFWRRRSKSPQDQASALAPANML